MKRKKSKKPSKKVESFSHPEAKRKNIPTVQHQPFMPDDSQNPDSKAFKRPNTKLPAAMQKAIAERDEDLDPQLVWKGKGGANPHELVAKIPRIYIQEKVHPKALIADLMRHSKQQANPDPEPHPDLFGDYNGLPKGKRADYYQHSGNWKNRMILGDSLRVMASLIEKEGLGGQAQVFYFDPPYGIKFNSNFQWTTTSRAVKDGDGSQIPREPETVKAFRDTWRHGIHSYLNYIRDRLTLARELLHQSGSIFLQIGDQNVHRMRVLLDELFGEKNFVSIITVQKAVNQTALHMPKLTDFILWYAKDKTELKFRHLFRDKLVGDAGSHHYNQIRVDDTTMKRVKQSEHPIEELCHPRGLTSNHEYSRGKEPIQFQGNRYLPGGTYYWSSSPDGI